MASSRQSANRQANEKNKKKKNKQNSLFYLHIKSKNYRAEV